jgi:hypothetical protein
MMMKLSKTHVWKTARREDFASRHAMLNFVNAISFLLFELVTNSLVLYAIWFMGKPRGLSVMLD